MERVGKGLWRYLERYGSECFFVISRRQSAVCDVTWERTKCGVV